METRKSTVRDVETLAKLCFHEVSRVFKDRMNTEEDHHWLEDKMHDLMEVNFRVRSRETKIYFSNILKLDTKEYEQLPDLKKVVNVLNEIQEDHNASSDTKLNLIFFNEAVENILKIHRILTMARGNALLIGVSGSGKQSLTKLSSYINSYKV
jgi:dynein heavy chain